MKRDLAILVALGFLAGSASLLPSGIAHADDKTVTTTEKTYGDHDHDLDDADSVTKKKIVKHRHHGDKEIIKKKTVTKGEPDDETVVEKKTTTTHEED